MRQRKTETREAYVLRRRAYNRKWQQANRPRLSAEQTAKRRALAADGRCPYCACPLKGRCEKHLPDAVAK